MKKSFNTPSAFLFILITLASLQACKKPADTTLTEDPQPIVYTPKDIYHYSFTSLDGDPIKISGYKGKKIMFVNTASFCGNTPQYEKLEKLYKTYGSKLVILGFPCNQFGDQEPGADGTIKDFCTNTYGVTFPMSTKIDVKGPQRDSIYIWLTEKSMNGVLSSTVDWNFQKYLVDENGKFMEMFSNTMQPDDPKIIAAINK